MQPFLKIPKVKTKEEGLREAMKVCICKQKTFAGVYWIIDGTRYEYTWSQINSMVR